jgi:hypothetical protein
LLVIILPFESCFCHGNSGFIFMCTSCIICYYDTQICEIFHILLLFFMYHNLLWDGCLESLITLVCPHFFIPNHLQISIFF